jgi:peptide/nickel transport system permease protein
MIGLIIVGAIFAPWLAPHNPNAVNLTGAYAGPSRHFLLGQDSSGRDILSRLIFGSRLSLLGPSIVIVLAVGTGVPLGLLAGYSGGWVDGLLARIFDLVFAFPSLLLAIVIVATFGASFYTAVVAVGITYVPLMGRVVRSAALVERHKPYVEACRIQGYGTIRMVVVHMAPNIVRVIIAQATLYFAYALLDLAALSFLGLGAQPPQIDWGGMLEDANQGVFQSPTGVVPPALAIVVLVVSVNLVADWLTDRGTRSR